MGWDRSSGARGDVVIGGYEYSHIHYFRLGANWKGIGWINARRLKLETGHYTKVQGCMYHVFQDQNSTKFRPFRVMKIDIFSFFPKSSNSSTITCLKTLALFNVNQVPHVAFPPFQILKHHANRPNNPSHTPSKASNKHPKSSFDSPVPSTNHP